MDRVFVKRNIRDSSDSNEKDVASLLPAILTGHYTPGVAERFDKFCDSAIWH